MDHIEIRSIHFQADTKLKDYIEKKVRKLEQYFDRIVDARVVLKLENTGRVRDKITEIKLKVPGDLLIGSGTGKTFEAGVEDAFDNVRRQLSRYKERLRM